MSASTEYDVAVVGGGVIGLSIAWRARRRGLTVVVIDPAPAAAASHAAAGMLAPVSEARYGEEHLLALGLESLRRYPAFVAELEAAAGHQVGLRQDGTLIVATDAGFSPEESVRWLLSESSALPGRPVDAMAAGRDTAVKRVAMALAF